MSAPSNNVKVTREQWVDVAVAALQHTSIDELKVLALADTLEVSRSSFYWYFENREQLLEAITERWQRNTRSIVQRAKRSAPTVTAAVLGVFECWADDQLFDVTLDHAVREWARRDGAARQMCAAADATRLSALAAMFRRYGFDKVDATVRARLVYHSQIGLYAVAEPETDQQRLERLPSYVRAMTGKAATAAELRAFAAFVATRR